MRDNVPSEYRCCFCLHVRTGTILFGSIQMLLQFCGMLILLYHVLFFNRPFMSVSLNNGGFEKAIYNPTTDSDALDNLNIHVKSSNSQHVFENLCFALLLTTLSFVATSMLVQGAWQNKPSYLLPFFCLQIFDFIVSCLTVAGFFSYDDVKRWVTEQVNNQFVMRQLSNVDIHYMLAVVVVLTAMILTLKAYFICLVWACYKFLCEQNRSCVGITTADYNFTPVYPNSSGNQNPPDAEILLPPKYEDVIKSQQLQSQSDN